MGTPTPRHSSFPPMKRSHQPHAAALTGRSPAAGPPWASGRQSALPPPCPHCPSSNLPWPAGAGPRPRAPRQALLPTSSLCPLPGPGQPPEKQRSLSGGGGAAPDGSSRGLSPTRGIMALTGVGGRRGSPLAEGHQLQKCSYQGPLLPLHSTTPSLSRPLLGFPKQPGRVSAAQSDHSPFLVTALQGPPLPLQEIQCPPRPLLPPPPPRPPAVSPASSPVAEKVKTSPATGLWHLLSPGPRPSWVPLSVTSAGLPWLPICQLLPSAQVQRPAGSFLSPKT